MFRILIVLISLFVLTAPAAEASRYHRTRPAWRAKPSAIQVRVAPSSRIRLVVKRPPRPGPRYTWRASEWVWQPRGWYRMPAAWILLPSSDHNQCRHR